MSTYCNNRIDLSGLSRRDMLRRSGYGLGAMYLSALLGTTSEAGEKVARKPDFKGTCKRVIHIFAGGAPSHLDTFDPKPGMQALSGKSGSRGGALFPTPFKFNKSGKSGLEISELFPKLSERADDLCVIRSMTTDVPAHEVASQLMVTGNGILKRPSLGSWTLYGLGVENENLPGFVSMGGNIAARQAAFLPSMYQGALANYAPGRKVEETLLNLRSEFNGLEEQRKQLDLARKLDVLHMKSVQKDEQLESRIDSFELAFKMQTAATDAFDIMKESAEVRARYGATLLGGRLLIARRLAERGVRFIQIDAGGWDHHYGLSRAIKKTAGDIDQPVAALLQDLKERGLLDSTLVVWGGEFGRTPTTAGRVSEESGRDHHAEVFCAWMAGGGVKGGMAWGESDEIGDKVGKDGVHVHDLHATIMHLMGFDHTKLTYRYNGRDFRLTDNFGKVVHGIIA
ncbi:MAG: DUF1501 domain-containing protein [Planctomycetota bacterium]